MYVHTIYIVQHTKNKNFLLTNKNDQAKITSYEDGRLLKMSHSKITQQLCNPQGSGKPKNNQQHITPNHNICNDIRLSSYHLLRSTPCNGLLFHQDTLLSGDLHDESSDLEEAAGRDLNWTKFLCEWAFETYQQGHQQHSPKTFDTSWEKKQCYVDTQERH